MNETLIALKWCRAELNKKLVKSPSGGIKLSKTDKISYKEMVEEINLLIKAEKNEKLRIVNFCRECKNWSGTATSKRGCCFPKEYTSGRLNQDFCSLFISNERTVYP